MSIPDYLDVLKKYAKEGDIIFLDPPYYPVGKYSDFKRYTNEFFYHEDHVNLKNEFSVLKTNEYIQISISLN